MCVLKLVTLRIYGVGEEQRHQRKFDIQELSANVVMGPRGEK